MKKISLAIPLLLAIHVCCSQQGAYTRIGAYSKDLGDAFSGSINQAALASMKQVVAGVYGERKFLLRELSYYTAAIALPSPLGGFGFSLQYSGEAYFNTSAFGIGYGKRLGDKIAAGIQFNYTRTRLAGYGSREAIGFEAGTLLQLTEQLQLGIHLFQPANSKMEDGIPVFAYTAGLGYTISGKVYLGVELRKEQGRPVQISAGMQYSFARSLFARLGMATATGNYFAGLGLQWKNIRLDAITAWHTPLGITPALMLQFHFFSGNTESALEN